MVRVAFGSHGREKAVQLAIRVIFDIVPHFKTQVGASIKFHSQKSGIQYLESSTWNPVPGIQNPRLAWIPYMGRFQRLVTFISSAWLDALLHLTPSPIKSLGENYDNILLRWISITGLPRSLDSCMYYVCFCISFSYWVGRLIIGQHQIFIKMLRIFFITGKSHVLGKATCMGFER